MRRVALRRVGLLRWCLALAVGLAGVGCDSTLTGPPKPPAPVDPCLGLTAPNVTVVPNVIAFNGAANVSASGGSGRFTFRLTNEMPAGSLTGTRYVADHGTGTDTVVATDDCGNMASATVLVTAAFKVEPSRARVSPGATLTIRVSGNKGPAEFSPQGGRFESGGKVEVVGNDGRYEAGPDEGLDVVLVRDSLTGAQASAMVEVAPGATFAPASPRLAVPAGSFVPLETVNGSGVVSWKVKDGSGSIEQRAEGPVYVAPLDGGLTATLEVTDLLLDRATPATVKVRTLTELIRPGLPAQGRRTDLATMVTADFDGDGISDLAVGVRENDLNRPSGGAVFIFKGGADGLPTKPTWTIVGLTDTARFGEVMAAGDLDGDGKADLAISAPGDDVTIADSGAVYLYTIGPDGPRQLRAPLTGLGRGGFGTALAIADVDRDGDQDLIVGSPSADIAPGAGFTARGVIDIFVLQRGEPIADTGTLKLGGQDVDNTGALRRFSNLNAGRGLTAADFNNDGTIDLGVLTTINNTPLSDGGYQTRAVTAVQVHLGRLSATKPFEDTPDLFVVPTNTGDGNEGNYRLDTIPAQGGRPTLLVAAGDRFDSPDLRALDAGTAALVDPGGALLFDLSGFRPASTPPTNPPQVPRLSAWARVYGSQAGEVAGRSLALFDATGDGNPDLVLGAPYASAPTDGGSMLFSGRLEVYALDALSRGAVTNRPTLQINGRDKVQTLGTSVIGWNGSLVTVALRASTELGVFTGRVDAFTPSSASPAEWALRSAPLPSKPSGQQFGQVLEVGPVNNALQVLVGVPNMSGPSGDGSGGELGAGQGIVFRAAAPELPQVLAEGANAPYLTDAGLRAFGGRTIAADVTMTDFDGDGRLDLAIAAPAFTPPTRLSDGGLSSSDYALNNVSCASPGSPGAVLVHAAQSDGTFKEAFRVWGVRDIPGCVVPDGGAVTICQRSNLTRSGLIGGFDFNGDGKQDLGAVRSNGFEVLAGRSPDDPQFNKPTMSCDVAFSLPFVAQTTSAPGALGDLDGDGCDEVGLRYSDGVNRQGVFIIFGFDPGGARCMGHDRAAWLRLSGDTETGIPTMRLGIAMTRAQHVLATGADAVAITANFYPFEGQPQPAVLLVPTSELVAKRPASGEQLVGIIGGGLHAVPLIPNKRAPDFGRSVMGDVDVDGDGKKDLVVSAPGASLNGDGTGAVMVFKGGTVTSGVNRPSMVIVADHRERASFGVDLSLSASKGPVPAALGIGAPLSYRQGTANGTAFVLPLDF